MQTYVKSCMHIIMQTHVKARTQAILLCSLFSMLICIAPNMHAMLGSSVRLAKMHAVQAPAMRALQACVQSPGRESSVHLSAKRFHKDTASKLGRPDSSKEVALSYSDRIEEDILLHRDRIELAYLESKKELNKVESERLLFLKHTLRGRIHELQKNQTK